MVDEQAKPQKIAAWWHLAVYLAIVAGITLLGFRSQHASPSNPAPALDVPLQTIRNILISILGDCALAYFCWAGVHWYGVRDGHTEMEKLTGGRWLTWQGLGKDLAIALPFWIVWEGTAYGTMWLLRLFGPDTAHPVTGVLPQTALETVFWIALSVVAGVTEEIQSRGYLQRQLHALSGNLTVAVLGQAIVFGFMHSYQGLRKVLVISILGVLYGALAAWRKNLRVNMIAHAWSDVWEGWLKMIVFR
jgi:membrane protease YdiL (CAAX protease family)